MIQSVDRAARILHELGSGSPTLGVTELGARLDLAKPTVHGLLRTLEQSGLVSQDVATGRYSLGPRVLQLGNAYLAGSELRARSMLRAGSLARQVDEAVWVSVLVDDAVMVVHHEFRPDDAVQILEVGATIPWHACALGHAMVAALPERRGRRAARRAAAGLTGRTRTSPEALRKALERVQDKGFAVENQEANVGDARHRRGHLRPRRPGGRLAGRVGPAERLLQRQAKARLVPRGGRDGACRVPRPRVRRARPSSRIGT